MQFESSWIFFFSPSYLLLSSSSCAGGCEWGNSPQLILAINVKLKAVVCGTDDDEGNI